MFCLVLCHNITDLLDNGDHKNIGRHLIGDHLFPISLLLYWSVNNYTRMQRNFPFLNENNPLLKRSDSLTRLVRDAIQGQGPDNANICTSRSALLQIWETLSWNVIWGLFPKAKTFSALPWLNICTLEEQEQDHPLISYQSWMEENK